MNRIEELRNKEGLSQAELGALAGTSQQQIAFLEKGERRLTVEWMERLAPHLHAEPSELMKRKANNKLPRKIYIIGRAPGSPLKETIETPKDDDGANVLWIESDITTLAGLQIEGDSMDRARLHDGDIAIVDYSQRDHTKLDGQVVVVVCEGETTIKRLRLGPPLRLEPDSTNKEHQAIYPNGEKNWYIWGRVLKSQGIVE